MADLYEGTAAEDQRADDAVAMLRSLPDMVLAINKLSTTTKTVFPAVQSVTTTATAGAAGALPATVDGYLAVTLPDGRAARVPYFLP